MPIVMSTSVAFDSSMTRNNLDFCITEKPSWRTSNNTATTSDMLRDIASYMSNYDNLPPKAKEFADSSFSRGMTVEYVFHSNMGECVGTQTYEDTKELIEAVFLKRDKQKECSSKEETESVNTCKALAEMQRIKVKEMDHTGYLTVELLCQVHKILMDGLHLKKGMIRDSPVYTRTGDGIHYYPDPDSVNALLYGVVDHHNIHMKHFENNAFNTVEDKLKFIAKSAAWLLFHFVSTHPFSDGNGRMCRLLGNYVFSLITPFPVSVYHKTSGRSHREDYIEAIVKCRKDPLNRPCDLTAMLVEGAWHGWKNLFENLKLSHNEHLIREEKQLGPVVIENSTKIEDIKQKVVRVCEGNDLDVANVIKKIQEAISCLQLANLEPLQHVEHPIHFVNSNDVKFVLTLYIYN